jgi:hypothetical protein
MAQTAVRTVCRSIVPSDGVAARLLGFLRVYREGKDDATLRDEERQPLPPLAGGPGLADISARPAPRAARV